MATNPDALSELDAQEHVSMREDYISLPPEEELLRLRKLPTAELVNELFFARQRLRTFLEEKGIPVPEFILDTQTHKALLDLASSLSVENFNREVIRGLGDDVEAVNSSVKSFVMLFDSLISTNSFEQVLVSVEGAEEPCTVKQLLEQYDNSRIDEDRRVVVSVRDLKSQLSSLIDEHSSGSKSFEDVDDEDIAAIRKSEEEQGDNAYASRLGQGSYSFGQYSPFLSQEMLDAMIAKQENAEEYFSDSLGEDSEWGGSRSRDGQPGTGKAEDVNVFDDNAEIPKEQTDIFDDFYDVEDGGSEHKQQENLSAEDIDKLIGSM